MANVDAARKETPRAEAEEQPTSCLACGTPIGVGHGTYSGSFCASCGPKVPIVRAGAKAHEKGFTTVELWEDLASKGSRPPRKEHLAALLQALGYVEFEGMWIQQR